MALSDITDATAVLKAVHEFDDLGRRALPSRCKAANLILRITLGGAA